MRDLTKKEKRVLAINGMINKIMMPLALFMIRVFKVSPRVKIKLLGRDDKGWNRWQTMGFDWFHWERVI